MKPNVLLAVMAFGCSPVMAEDIHSEYSRKEVDGPALVKCIKSIHEGNVTYWADLEGNESFDLVRPPARFELVEDLGEVEMEDSGKSTTYKVHDYEGLCTFEYLPNRSDR